jgi:hypothetical protein
VGGELDGVLDGLHEVLVVNGAPVSKRVEEAVEDGGGVGDEKLGRNFF